MRLLLLTLCGIFAFGQQDPATPRFLTPEQEGFQLQMREADAQRERLKVVAKAAFDSEMEREKSEDCPYAPTSEYNSCFSKEVGITDQNLKTYEGAFRDFLGLKYPELASQPKFGPSGPILTSAQMVAEFDQVEQIWHSYLDTASTAAFHQFGGGSGGPGFAMETHLRLVRGHLRELDSIYGLWLRK
jgi:hypothetical protein